MKTLFVGKTLSHPDGSHKPKIPSTPETDDSCPACMVSQTLGL